MGALAAILQSDPNLLRCQLKRLDASVALQEDERLPDAYGFGHYSGGSVLLGKRPSGVTAALSVADLVGKVDSEALLVQARRAVIGQAKDENTQPFRFRRWLFAHDGTIEGWDRLRPKLVAALPDFLRRNVMGDTDSEHAFMWFLKQLRDDGRLDDLELDAVTAGRALARTVKQIEAWAREAGEQRTSRLCFVATNGRIMVASRRAGPLHYALLEGIVPCALDGIDLGTPESDPRVRPHRLVKAVAFASRLRQPNGFIEVPEGSVVSVSRTLQVTVSPIANAG
ncbi:MAG TPA: class II glutamine amidotransferase [Anaeromyxobacter sp.]|nr:class II glutamine amidotransferase [Anaeromyxobacter sp.]